MATVSTISGEGCDVCGHDAACEVRTPWYAGPIWPKMKRGQIYTYILCAKCLASLVHRADREAQIAQEFSDAAVDWQDREA